MFRYADPDACPVCRSPIATYSTECQTCGTRLAGSVAERLFTTLTHADALVAELATGTPSSAVTGARATGAGSSTNTPLVPIGQPAHPMKAHPSGPGKKTGRGMSGASVPKILLGLGATCLLVAAVVFLAVAWSSLGVGGRTGVLVVLTSLAGALSWLLAGKGLRAGAEAFMTVGLGLLTLDVFGAANAGWIGAVGSTGFQAILGAVLGAAGLGAAHALRRSPAGPLVSAQVVGAIGIGVLATSPSDQRSVDLDALLVLGALLVVAAGAVATRALRLPVAAVVLVVGAAFLWFQLALTGLFRFDTTPTFAEVWGTLSIWPLLAAAAVGACLALVKHLPLTARVTGAGVAVFLTVVALTIPMLDESASLRSFIALGVVVVACTTSALLPRAWRPALMVPPALAALGLLAALSSLAVRALEILLARGEWVVSAGFALPDPGLVWHWPLFLPGGVLGVLLTAWLVTNLILDLPIRRVALPVALTVAASATLLPALYGAPLGVAVGVLLVTALILLGIGLGLPGLGLPGLGLPSLGLPGLDLPVLGDAGLGDAGLGDAALGGTRLDGTGLAGTVALVLAAPTGGLALLVSAQSEVLMAVTTGVAAALALALALGGDRQRRVVGDLAFTPAAALFLWTVLDLAGVDAVWRSLPLLVLAGAWAILGARPEREIPAAFVAVVGASAALGSGGTVDQTWLAIDLTLAGVLTQVSALVHGHRRWLGWVGLALLTMAQWVRMVEVGVETPEAYTLPLALVLIAVGAFRMHRNASLRSAGVLSPGLLLALVPSLVMSLDDPASLRALLLGIGCLVAVGVGAARRWSAPLVIGAVIGVILVLRELFHAYTPPQWVVIGVIGIVLTVVGVTWESRLANVRKATGYLRHLR